MIRLLFTTKDAEKAKTAFGQFLVSYSQGIECPKILNPLLLLLLKLLKFSQILALRQFFQRLFCQR